MVPDEPKHTSIDSSRLKPKKPVPARMGMSVSWQFLAHSSKRSGVLARVSPVSARKAGTSPQSTGSVGRSSTYELTEKPAAEEGGKGSECLGAASIALARECRPAAGGRTKEPLVSSQHQKGGMRMGCGWGTGGCEHCNNGRSAP
eukprot:1827252-Rhodomonas_salina.1